MYQDQLLNYAAAAAAVERFQLPVSLLLSWPLTLLSSSGHQGRLSIKKTLAKRAY